MAFDHPELRSLGGQEVLQGDWMITANVIRTLRRLRKVEKSTGRRSIK